MGGMASSQMLREVECRYVRRFVDRGEIPNKFRDDERLLKAGVVFPEADEGWREIGVKVVLPMGYSLLQSGSVMEVRDANGQVAFSARADCTLPRHEKEECSIVRMTWSSVGANGL